MIVKIPAVIETRKLMVDNNVFTLCIATWSARNEKKCPAPKKAKVVAAVCVSRCTWSIMVDNVSECRKDTLRRLSFIRVCRLELLVVRP